MLVLHFTLCEAGPLVFYCVCQTSWPLGPEVSLVSTPHLSLGVLGIYPTSCCGS